MTTRTQARAHLSKDLRRDLWVAAGGRCEFRGCCAPIDRDFLTKDRRNVSEYAHIIADSPGGARGVVGLSEALASDIRNLMLLCRPCHGRIDHGGPKNPYKADELRAMKAEHENRIELVYSANGTKISLPIILTYPVGQQLPVVHEREVNYAILKNSEHRRFPQDRAICFDRTAFDHHDGEEEFWPAAERSLERLYAQRLQPTLTGANPPEHLTIAAFAPIPMLMKLGALLGNKMDADVLDLPDEQWLWDTRAAISAPSFSFSVPESLPAEVAVAVSISNTVQRPVVGVPFVEFKADSPDRGIIRTAEHLKTFRREFDRFLLTLIRVGARELHIYPATPLSASVEMGRVLLPKTFSRIQTYDWQSNNWKKAICLKR